MPALITICAPQKQKSRPEAAFDFPRYFPRLLRSTLRVLLAPPRFVQSHFLSLDLSRVARHQTRGAERRFQCCIILDQRARYAMAHGAGLAALAAAVDVHQDVKTGQVLGQLERLAHHHAAGLAAEERIHRLAVHHERALAGLQEYAGHGALAPPGAVVIIADHQISRFLGCCAECGCCPPPSTLSLRSLAYPLGPFGT